MFMMCTLPSEGVSFCLSAAAKSLLNKKADVKVSYILSLICFLYIHISTSCVDFERFILSHCKLQLYIVRSVQSFGLKGRSHYCAILFKSSSICKTPSRHQDFFCKRCLISVLNLSAMKRRHLVMIYHNRIKHSNPL